MKNQKNKMVLYIPFILMGYYYLPSFIHAVGCTLFLPFLFLLKPPFHIYASELAFYWIINYFIFDLVENYYRFKDTITYFHHLVSIVTLITGYWLSTENEPKIYDVTVIACILEISNLYLNTALQVFQKKNEYWFFPMDKFRTGLMMGFIFFISRIVMFPIYVFFFQTTSSPFEVYTFGTPFFLMNIYWFTVMVKGSIKEYHKLQKRKEKSG